jgi:hypothetical protein
MPPHYCVALAFLALQQKVVVAIILGMVAFEQLCLSGTALGVPLNNGGTLT